MLSVTEKQANALRGNIDKPSPKPGVKLRFSLANEAELQLLIVMWLRHKGYEVSEIGQYFQSQRKVNSVGYPDLSIRYRTWPRGMALLLEVKRPGTGRLSVAQKTFFDAGGSFVVHSLEDAQEAIKDFEDSWDKLKLFCKENPG